MTMFAKYPGRCAKCGRRIVVGEKIEWEPQTRKASHVNCVDAKIREEQAAAKTAETRKAAEAQAVKEREETPYSIGGGSGYGYGEYHAGQIARASDKKISQGWPEWLYVVSASKSYFSEDGMSFGVGDERGYIYSAECRAATEEEAAKVKAEREAALAHRAAKTRASEIAKMIQDTGECPQAEPIGPNKQGYREDYCPGFILRGEKLLDTSNIYGSGNWFVIEASWIWYVRNNGMDGDAWGANNIRTGGAGAIGWRIALDTALADELRKLDALLK